MTIKCPLCLSFDIKAYYQDKQRAYVNCSLCRLVFVPERFHLSNSQEKAVYDKHNNEIGEKGYLTFLSRTIDPLVEKLNAITLENWLLEGLDFGCGPAPALAHELRKRGYSMSVYDPFYFPNLHVLNKKYDFITCTEVIEHIAAPRTTLEMLLKRLKPSGILAVMTKRVINKESFSTWHYKNDPTHICFYSDKTFLWIAKTFQLNYEFISKDVIFLTKL